MQKFGKLIDEIPEEEFESGSYGEEDEDDSSDEEEKISPKSSKTTQ